MVVDSETAQEALLRPELYRKMGCEVQIELEPDGNFPNHHPDPTKDKNIAALKEKTFETNADFGSIAFDGDSDRVGVVDNTGYNIPGDQLLLLFALDILEKTNPKTKNLFLSLKLNARKFFLMR
ncbi:MAG: hypothetical protein MZU97_26740 [Bacillus subtilis]|nr:hypothetical protein [Bacillus subtilis]